jgi:MFS family permease
VPEAQRGVAYGLRQSLDSVGAVIGPLAALALLAWLAVDLRTAIWVAVIPGIAAVLVIVFFVRDPVPAGAAGAARSVRVPIRFADLRRLGAPFWLIVVLGTVLTLARFSEAFLVLRATDVGLGIVWAPAVMVVMSLVYALVSYPAGIAVDRGHGRALLLWGLAALVAADVVLALATAGSALFAGVALWGIHMGLTQGLLSTLIAAVAPPRLRGTAFGLFNLVTGIALVAASVLAGVLWERLGAAATFWAGAAFTAVALAGLAAWRPAAGTERAGA